MGQRPRTDVPARRTHGSERVGATDVQLAVFPAELGWFALWGVREQVAGLLIGHVSEEEVRAAARRRMSAEGCSASANEADWFPALRRDLIRYSEGRPIDFDDYNIVWDGLSPFQLRVVEATRAVPYGKTITYGELADAAGSPGAARAVGSVMATNRIPILIPCHRVVAAGGKLGGFSAPRGPSLKQQMLSLESALLHNDSVGSNAKENTSRKSKYSAVVHR